MSKTCRGFLPIAALALTACAQQPTAEIKPIADVVAARGYAIGEPVKEILNYRVDGWNSVDANHVIINAGPSSDYLLTLMAPCTGLLFTSELGFTSTAGRLTTLDSVVVQDSSGRSQCPISKIEALKRVKHAGESSTQK